MTPVLLRVLQYVVLFPHDYSVAKSLDKRLTSHPGWEGSIQVNMVLNFFIKTRGFCKPLYLNGLVYYTKRASEKTLGTGGWNSRILAQVAIQ